MRKRLDTPKGVIAHIGKARKHLRRDEKQRVNRGTRRAARTYVRQHAQ